MIIIKEVKRLKLSTKIVVEANGKECIFTVKKNRKGDILCYPNRKFAINSEIARLIAKEYDVLENKISLL